MRTYMDLGDRCQLLTDPTIDDLRHHFASHVVERLLYHLESETGSVETDFETACVAIAKVFWTPFHIDAVYRTEKRDPKTGTVIKGIQFGITRHFFEVMRALIVTADGHVAMQREHRRLQGGWVDMLCAGGTKKNDRLDTLISEMINETGCRPTKQSRIWRLRRSCSDDGVLMEPFLNYLAVDRVKRPDGNTHTNLEDNIRGVMFMPFNAWREEALDGHFRDPFTEAFAARCSYDESTQRLTVRGEAEILRQPSEDA